MPLVGRKALPQKIKDVVSTKDANKNNKKKKKEMETEMETEMEMEAT